MNRRYDSFIRTLLGIMIVTVGGCAAYGPAPLATSVEPVLAGTAVDLSKPLTPRALGLIAVVTNPDLKAARLQAGVADAQVFAAGLLPDPVFNLSFDKLLTGPDMFDGLGAQLIYDLAAFRDRGLVQSGQHAARAQVRLDLAWREWQTAGQARLLGARVVGLERASTLLDRSQAAAEDALARVLAAAARGDLKADDVEARRLATADAADRARQSERDLGAARGSLNALLGLPPGTRITIAADPVSATPLDAGALFDKARASRLDLKALEAGYQSQEAAVRKAALDAFPSLQLTLAAARDTADNRTLGPAVNFTLPVWNRNSGGIAIARATREQLRAEYAARVFAARAEIADLVERIAIARRQRGQIADTIGPLEALAGRTEAAAAGGDVARAVAEAGRQSVIYKQITLAALDQAIAEQTVALELATGAPLPGPAQTRGIP